MRFTNAVDEKASFNKSFSAFSEYDTSMALQDAESALIPRNRGSARAGYFPGFGLELVAMGAFREYLAALGAAEVRARSVPGWTMRSSTSCCDAASGSRRPGSCGPRSWGARCASRRGGCVAGCGLLSLPRVDGSVITAETPDDLIDRFLREEDLRIVVRNDQPESASEQVRTEAELSDEEDLVSEELAEIYLAQGLRSEALAAYRKLSLLNPEKSVYFAKIIGQIETNN